MEELKKQLFILVLILGELGAAYLIFVAGLNWPDWVMVPMGGALIQVTKATVKYISGQYNL